MRELFNSNMRNGFFQEILVSSALLILLIPILNPFNFWTPNVKMTAIILIIAFAVFANFIWKENARDEREAFHRMAADRIAFLAGSGISVAGIIIQNFKGSVDFWLVLTLSTMIFAKALGRVYSRVRH